VLAVVLGVLIGLALRRTLPAMALTLGLMVVIQVALPLWVRPHLAPPVSSIVTLGGGTLDGIAADSAGHPVSITAHTASRGDWVLTNATVSPTGQEGLPTWMGSCSDPKPCLARLTAEGYRQKLVYQPAARFWRLQVSETLLCLLAAAGLAGLVVAGVRRVD
jgi:hypothetical protein